MAAYFSSALCRQPPCSSCRARATITSEEPAIFNAALSELFAAVESGRWMSHQACILNQPREKRPWPAISQSRWTTTSQPCACAMRSAAMRSRLRCGRPSRNLRIQNTSRGDVRVVIIRGDGDLAFRQVPISSASFRSAIGHRECGGLRRSRRKYLPRHRGDAATDNRHDQGCLHGCGGIARCIPRSAHRRQRALSSPSLPGASGSVTIRAASNACCACSAPHPADLSYGAARPGTARL